MGHFIITSRNIGVGCWSVAGRWRSGLLLIVSARGIRMQQARTASHLQQLAGGEIAPVRPLKALLKPRENAYAAVTAELKAVKTTGFTAGTTGISVRVAKGDSVRTSGTRGGATK